MRKRILMIVNPTAGRRRRDRLEGVMGRLTSSGCSLIVRETTAPGDAERFAEGASLYDFDAVAAAGGDGTINEVLNGLRPGGPPLAILPLGTANVLAAEIGLSSSIDEIAETMATGPSRRISIGEVNGRRFAVMASVGLDANVVEGVDLELKRRVGKWAYAYETARKVVTSPPTLYRLRVNGSECDAFGVIVANGRHYAGRFVAAPAAHLEKPSLEICRLTRPGRLAVPRYLLSIARGRLAGRSDVQIDEATAVEIIGPAGAPLQADGDILCRLPATIRVVPNAIDLIFPSTAATVR